MPTGLKNLVEKRLAELNLNAFEAARKGELERGFINDILQGKKDSVRGKNIAKLATAIDVTPDVIITAITTNYEAHVQHVGRSSRIPDFARDPAYWSGAAGIGGEIPLFGATEGGPGALMISNEPIGTVERPGPLQGVKDGYAVYIVGDSMEPEFEPGDIALVHPRLPPVPNTTAIFYTNNQTDDRAMIKRLVRATADSWHVRQWNPPEGQKAEFTLKRSEWPVCRRVVGKYSRR